MASVFNWVRASDLQHEVVRRVDEMSHVNVIPCRIEIGFCVVVSLQL